MYECLFCTEVIEPVPVGRTLAWASPSGSLVCTTDGVSGQHYPGREAELFWRGSIVVDLTGVEPHLEVTDLVTRRLQPASR